MSAFLNPDRPAHPLVVDNQTGKCRLATQEDIHRFERIVLKYQSLLVKLKEAIGDA
jgi:hypothetical protein